MRTGLNIIGAIIAVTCLVGTIIIHTGIFNKHEYDFYDAMEDVNRCQSKVNLYLDIAIDHCGDPMLKLDYKQRKGYYDSVYSHAHKLCDFWIDSTQYYLDKANKLK